MWQPLRLKRMDLHSVAAARRQGAGVSPSPQTPQSKGSAAESDNRMPGCRHQSVRPLQLRACGGICIFGAIDSHLCLGGGWSCATLLVSAFASAGGGAPFAGLLRGPLHASSHHRDGGPGSKHRQ
eukprot:SAG31_NODE_4691_length_3030_cov_1.452747_1_plen_125_part_00